MTRPNLDDKTLGLFIREQQKDLSARKSIKVKLPIRQHIKLHALKLFTENNISETVERALDSYFDHMSSEGNGPGVEVGTVPAGTEVENVGGAPVQGTVDVATGAADAASSAEPVTGGPAGPG